MTMTLNDLNATVREVLDALKLGEGSWRRSSAYHDYVALQFACFADNQTFNQVERRFQQLCRQHNWECCEVTMCNDCSIHVTMHEHRVTSANSRRMALGAGA